MTSVSIEVEDEVLAKAEWALRARGSDVQQELAAHLASLIADRKWVYDEKRSAAQNFVSYAEFLDLKFDGELPDRDERNCR